MRFRIGPIETLRLIRSFFKYNQKSLYSRLKSLIRNRGNDLTPALRFMFGKKQRYFGVLINEGKLVRHSLYLLFDNGKVKELGRVKLKSKNKDRAVRELYSALEKKGDVSKVLSYNPGGEVLFHPN